MNVVLDHTLTGLRMNRARTLTALAGLTAAVAVMTAAWHARSLGDGGQLAGMMLLTILVAATAISVDARQLRAAAVFDLSGATRRQRRAVVVVEAVVLALPAAVVGWAGGAAAAQAVGNEIPSFASVVGWTLLIAAFVSLFTGRIRTRVTTVDASGHRAGGRGSRPGWWWLVIGVLLVWGGYLLPTSSRSTSDLRLTLWPGITLAIIGMALLLPFVLLGVARLLDRLPWLTPNLAGALLRSRWHRLGPALLLGLATAFAVSVNGILGAGLDAREENRRTRLDALDITASVHPDDVVVGRADESGLLFRTLYWAAAEGDGDPGPLRLAVDAADRVRAQHPDATVTPIERLPAVTGTRNPLLHVLDERPVGVATPELLAALGLDRFADDVAAGRAVALDPALVRNGHTEIEAVGLIVDGDVQSDTVIDLPTVAADLPVLPLALPAILVPPSLDVPGAADSGEPLGPHSLLVRLPDRPTDRDAAALASLVMAGSETSDGFGLGAIEAWRGSERMFSPYEHGRLDAEGTAGLRQPGQVQVAVGLAALITLVGLFVTMGLTMATRRSDEEVVESLGASASTLRRLAVVQAVVVTALATSAGFAVGIALTRMGILQYNHAAELPPIPLIIPSVLWVGVVVVPLLAGLFAWLMAGRRRALDPSELADGLLW
jgi:hypothetical protein